MDEPTWPSSEPAMLAEGRNRPPDALPYEIGWRLCGATVGLGLTFAIACLVVGFLALRLLMAAESVGLLPTALLTHALQTFGIRWAPFILSVFSLLFYGGFFLGIWIVVHRTAGFTWQSLGWRAAPWRAYLLIPPVYVATLFCAGLALSLEAAMIFHGQINQINNPKNNPQQAVFGVAAHPSLAEVVLLFVSIAVVAPLVEELVFRGMLFQLLRRSLPLWAAVILSALVFALLHLIPVLIPTLFLFGVALALVFHYTRSLYCSICLHMLINTVAVIVIVLRP